MLNNKFSGVLNSKYDVTQQFKSKGYMTKIKVKVIYDVKGP